MRESMARLTPRFSTSRAVREYTEQYYLPAASTYRERAADRGAGGARLSRWRRALEQKWSALRLGKVRVDRDGDQHLFEVEVELAGLDPEAVEVELYADGAGDQASVRQEMTRVQRPAGTSGNTYRARVPAARPASDYTVRLVPHHDGAAIPLEEARILWLR
jgi:starch phosphorylase